MINLSEARVVNIQFFAGSNDYGLGDYSANIVINGCLVVQLSGNDNEAHRVSIPTSTEQYYNNEELQDWAAENLDLDDVEKFLDEEGVENNIYFLSENGEACE